MSTTQQRERSRKAAAEKDEFQLVGQVLGNRFEINSVEAAGGFALTYCAFDLEANPRRQVAIKVFKDRVDHADLMKEVEYQESFNHPSIPKVLGQGQSILPNKQVRCWIAMEWINGKTLFEFAQTEKAAEIEVPAFWLNVLRPIFEALEYAHTRKRVAHCDITPSNILIDDSEWPPKAYLLDFGTAKRLDPEGSNKSRTSTKVRPCTLAYLAPEQANPHALRGAATDVHALGLVLLWLLTKENPYNYTTETEAIAQAQSRQRPTLRSKGTTGGDWDAVLEKAVALEPKARYRTAGELLQALSRRPPTQLRRYKNRRPLVLMAVASSLVLLSGGSTAWLYVRFLHDGHGGSVPAVDVGRPKQVVMSAGRPLVDRDNSSGFSLVAPKGAEARTIPPIISPELGAQTLTGRTAGPRPVNSETASGPSGPSGTSARLAKFPRPPRVATAVPMSQQAIEQELVNASLSICRDKSKSTQQRQNEVMERMKSISSDSMHDHIDDQCLLEGIDITKPPKGEQKIL